VTLPVRHQTGCNCPEQQQTQRYERRRRGGGPYMVFSAGGHCPPRRKHHIWAPAPATSFVTLCLLLFLLRFVYFSQLCPLSLGTPALRGLQGFSYALAPDLLRLPSQPQSITAPCPVPNYTAWRQRYTCACTGSRPGVEPAAPC